MKKNIAEILDKILENKNGTFESKMLETVTQEICKELSKETGKNFNWISTCRRYGFEVSLAGEGLAFSFRIVRQVKSEYKADSFCKDITEGYRVWTLFTELALDFLNNKEERMKEINSIKNFNSLEYFSQKYFEKFNEKAGKDFEILFDWNFRQYLSNVENYILTICDFMHREDYDLVIDEDIIKELRWHEFPSVVKDLIIERISTAERGKRDVEVSKELDGDVRFVINGTVFVIDEELAENIESQQGYPLTEIKYNIPIYHK